MTYPSPQHDNHHPLQKKNIMIIINKMTSQQLEDEVTKVLMTQANSIAKRDKTRNQSIFFKKKRIYSFLLDQDNILLCHRWPFIIYIYISSFDLFIASWMYQSCIDRYTNKNTAVLIIWHLIDTRSTICFQKHGMGGDARFLFLHMFVSHITCRQVSKNLVTCN